MTHLFCEDWFRLFTFSSDKFKKITYVRDLISNLNPFYLPFLYLRQTILNLDIHASSAYNHFLSSDLFNSLVSLYKTSNIDVIHSSFLLSGFFNHSSNSDTQVFELKNKNIQLTDDVKDLFEKLSNLEHDYNNINQKLTDETQSHSDTKSESLIHQKNLDNEITAHLDTKNTLKDFQDKLQAFKKENQSLLKKLNSFKSELYLLKYKYNTQNITLKKQINKYNIKSDNYELLLSKNLQNELLINKLDTNKLMLSDDLRKCHEKLDRFEHSEKSLNKK